MLRTFLSTSIIALIVILSPECKAGDEGFPVGHLIATSVGKIVVINPATGEQTKVWGDGKSGYGNDVVYNARTKSAFVGGGKSISELHCIAPGRFELRPYLSGLKDASGLAVDRRGRIYFVMNQRIYRSDPTAVPTPEPITEYRFGYLFTGKFMSFSEDQCHLYVGVFLGGVDVVSLPGGSLSHLSTTEPLKWSGGVEVTTDGTVYVAQDMGTRECRARVVAVSPEGNVTTYSEKEWMEMGLLGDLAFDDRDGVLYVVCANAIHAIDNDGSDHVLYKDRLRIDGIDLISSIPESSDKTPSAAKNLCR